MASRRPLAAVSVINDLSTDIRVKKNCQALMDCGYEVLLIGRRLPSSRPVNDRPYTTVRMRLFFTTGPAFYLFFNLRLFFLLLFRRTNLLWANDLDTLLPNYLISKLKGIPLIYDSHELFCEVPELAAHPLKKRIWLGLEKFLVPRLKFCITVSDGIAAIFRKMYGTDFLVIRNIPPPARYTSATRQQLGLPPDKKIIILQGAGLNIDRGAEELLQAMSYVENALLLIIGGGDVWQKLKDMVLQLGLEQKARLIEKLPREQLMQYTACCDLGMSIDKDNNLNYRNSLPNKLFDYIQAGIPILASRLPEPEKIISHYQIGGFIDIHAPSHIAERISQMLDAGRQNALRRNIERARQELTWENEVPALLNLIRRAGTGGDENS